MDAEAPLERYGPVIRGRVVPVPGHTPGSPAVALTDAAFAGDLFRGSILGSSAEAHFYMLPRASSAYTAMAIVSRDLCSFVI